MKKLIIILLSIISISAFPATYYVATDGDDDNPGTISEPWATWGKGFTYASLAGGDTVYFRGGVYTMTVTNGNGYRNIKAGTEGSPIHFFAYPGEVPILDCANVEPTGSLNFGIYSNATNVHFKGLTIRNVRQTSSSVDVLGWVIFGDSAIIENCTMYNIGGAAFTAWDCEKTHFINCDSYNNCDSLSSSYPGNDGYGFFNINKSFTTGSVYYRGCRAWANGDDGFSLYDASYVEMDNCWSFMNGQLEGAGNGFKLTFTSSKFLSPPLGRRMTNCLAIYNRYEGINQNGGVDYPALSMQIYNNTIYRNGYMEGFDVVAYGVRLYNTAGTDEAELAQVWKNNISYGNKTGEFWAQANALYTHSNNTWDSEVTVSSVDFLSVDSTGLMGARQEDGSLPDLGSFLQLRSTSDLINAGVDVGIDYEGTAPDMGAYEYSPSEPPAPPNVATSSVTKLTPYTATVTINVTYDGGGTISQSGVCWSTSEDPTTSDSKTEEGEQAGVFQTTMSGLVKGTTYYVRAYATNETSTSYGENVEYTTPAVIRVKDGTKFVKWNGQFIDW